MTVPAELDGRERCVSPVVVCGWEGLEGREGIIDKKNMKDGNGDFHAVIVGFLRKYK